MRERATDEPHRSASPLELLFDLTSVVAVASITAQLARGIAHGYGISHLTPFLQVFFAIWWAWMNFTWFASSYDTDDVLYRLLTFLQMAGALVLAAGVPAAFGESDYRAVTLGYLCMRAGLVAQWVRAGIEHCQSRRTAFRYAAGISALEVGWLLRLFLAETGVLPDGLMLPIFIGLIALELGVPPWAERTRPTSWHAHHIAERYGLFLIILLGESVLAASTGVQAALEARGLDWSLVTMSLAGLVLLFALWWLYFLQPSGTGLMKYRERAFLWGYGHFGMFAAVAAAGAGLEVAVEGAETQVAVSAVGMGFAVAIPVAVFLGLLWVVHAPLLDRPVVRPDVSLIAVVVTLLLPLGTNSLGVTAIVTSIAALCVIVIVMTTRTASRVGANLKVDAPAP